MHQKMLGPEMAVENSSQKKVCKLPLDPGLLVKEFMRVDDPNRTGEDAKAKRYPQVLARG